MFDGVLASDRLYSSRHTGTRRHGSLRRHGTHHETQQTGLGDRQHPTETSNMLADKNSGSSQSRAPRRADSFQPTSLSDQHKDKSEPNGLESLAGSGRVPGALVRMRNTVKCPYAPKSDISANLRVSTLRIDRTHFTAAHV